MIKANREPLDLREFLVNRTVFKHLSREELELIESSEKENFKLISCEVSPNHLFLTQEDISKLGTIMISLPVFKNHCMTKITLGIAIYGAILSTIVIIWNLTQPLREKPKIKVVSKVGILSWGDTHEIVSFEAINLGKISVNLSSAGIYFEKKQIMPFIGIMDGLPKELNPGKNHTIFRPLYEFVKTLKSKKNELGEPKYIFFRDQTGKEYRGEMVNLKNFENVTK